MGNRRLLGLLGLARRAGRLVCGGDAVIGETAAGRAGIVLISADASPRTRRRMEKECKKNGVAILIVPATKEEIGHAIGRGITAVAAITDQGFAARAVDICRVCIREEG